MRVIKTKLSKCENQFGLGKIEIDFETQSYEGELLDTNVDIKIDTFAISYKDRENLINELDKVIQKYLI